MTTLLIIRHGQSLANVECIFAGELDAPLTGLGLLQAESTASYIASNYPVDKVYASDLSRAFHTGKAVADKLGLPVITDENLREIHAGAWEGLTFEELPIKYPETYRIWLTDIGNAAPDEGESVAHLLERIVNTLRRIGEDNPGKTVVVATHATPVRVLQCYCENKPLSEMKSIPWVTNASVTTVKYEDGQLYLQEVGRDAHLGTMVSALPANV